MTPETEARLRAACGVVLLAAPMLLLVIGFKACGQAASLAELRSELAVSALMAEQALAENQAALQLKTQDTDRLRGELAGLAKSKVDAYASNISLQEEKRLLEKQKDILTTSLLLDPVANRISLMRDSQAARGFAVAYGVPQAFGNIPGAAAGGRIVSKERFAAPNRSKYEEKNGSIDWEPMQEGDSARTSALGEYVLFVQGNLILHGPTKLKAIHDAYPHFCLGLTQDTAKSLYNAAFIGTRIAVPPVPKSAAKP